MRTMLVALALMVSGCAWTNRGSLVGHNQAAATPASAVDAYHAQRGLEMRAQLAEYERDPSYLDCKAKLANATTADEERARCRDFYARWTQVIANQRALLASHDQATESAQREDQREAQEEAAESRRAVGQAIISGTQEFARAHATTTTDCTPDGLGGVRCVSR